MQLKAVLTLREMKLKKERKAGFCLVLTVNYIVLTFGRCKPILIRAITLFNRNRTTCLLLLVSYVKSYWWHLLPLTNLTKSISFQNGKTQL